MSKLSVDEIIKLIKFIKKMNKRRKRQKNIKSSQPIENVSSSNSDTTFKSNNANTVSTSVFHPDSYNNIIYNKLLSYENRNLLENEYIKNNLNYLKNEGENVINQFNDKFESIENRLQPNIKYNRDHEHLFTIINDNEDNKNNNSRELKKNVIEGNNIGLNITQQNDNNSIFENDLENENETKNDEQKNEDENKNVADEIVEEDDNENKNVVIDDTKIIDENNYYNQYIDFLNNVEYKNIFKNFYKKEKDSNNNIIYSVRNNDAQPTFNKEKRDELDKILKNYNIKKPNNRLTTISGYYKLFLENKKQVKNIHNEIIK